MADRARAAAAALVLASAALVGALAPAASAGPLVASAAQIDEGELPVPERDPDDARDAADEILARSEFQPPKEGLVDRALDWIGERVGRLLSSGIGTGGELLGWVLLAGLVALVAWLVRRIRPTVRRTADAVAAPVVEVEEQRTAREWSAAAAEHEAAGRWVEALRCRYRALVTELVDHEAVRDVPGRTVGEYRAELAAACPPAAPPFEDATAVYEDAWYGHGRAGAEESARFARRADEVLAAVGR